MSGTFSLPIVPRYAEVDQQGVVFNGHYLTWFDEASTAYLDHVGVPFADLTAWGLDVQVVHAEIDYLAPVRWRDVVCVEARCVGVGTTSFTLGFDVVRSGGAEGTATAVRGRNVYVVVSTADWAKREVPATLVPATLRQALTSVAGQGRNGSDDGTVSP